MRICNRYLVQKPLGEGAFSKVFAGKDVLTDQDVAIKFDNSNVKSGKTRRDLVLYEAAVLTELHLGGTLKGIPRLHWNGYVTSKSKKEIPLIVIDRLGDDLETVITRRKKLSRRETSHIAVALLDIVQRLHEAGFLHRDLKPANIMLGYSDLNIYIADFGLAKKYVGTDGKHIAFTDKKSGITGTLRYCSTHTHGNVESSRRDDLQSLFFIVVYMLQGSLPWQSSQKKKKDPSVESDQRLCVAQMKTSLLYGKWNDSDLPKSLGQFASDIRQIEFEKTPDYDRLRSLLRAINE
jgi:serine/threonine protein kinase